MVQWLKLCGNVCACSVLYVGVCLCMPACVVCLLVFMCVL